MFAQTAMIVAFSMGGPANGELDLVAARFLTVDRTLTLIEPGLPLLAGRRGSLLAELEFRSDLTGPNGAALAPDMKVFWKLEDASGNLALADQPPEVPGFEWSGAREPVEVHVLSVDPLSGWCRARLELPVGGNGKGSIRYPHFPNGPNELVTLTAKLGWSERMHLDRRGQPIGELCSARLTFRASWPDVWVGLERPQGSPQLADDEVEFQLMLARPATEARRFAIEAQPPGRVEVMTPSVIVEGGQRSISIPVRGDDLGRFSLRVFEDGVLRAESNPETVVPAVVYLEVGTEADFASQAARESALGMLQKPDTLWFSRCIPAEGTSPMTHPTIELCGKCSKTLAIQPCPGEAPGSPPGSVHSPGSCVFGLDTCTYKVGKVQSAQYMFKSKRQVVCGTGDAKISVSGDKGGVGGGVQVGGSVTLRATCCTYMADPSVGTKTIKVLDCQVSSMWTLLVAALVLPPVSQDTDRETLEGELQARLSAPDSGLLTIESLFERYRVQPELLLRSIEHCKQIRGRWKPETPAEELWVSERQYVLTDPDWAPIALSLANSDPPEFTRGDRAVHEGTRYRRETREPIQSGPSEGQSLHRTVVRTHDELITWSYVGSERGPTERLRIPDHGGDWGTFVLHGDLTERVRVLLELAQAGGTKHWEGSSLEFSVDLRRPSHIAAFGELMPPLGMYEIPGDVVGRYETDSGGKASLVVDWQDPSGAVVHRDQIDWNKGRFPALIRRESYAPGTDVIIAASWISAVESPLDPADVARIAWIPEPNERVVDRRFARVLDYRAGPDGSIPSDGDLAARAGRVNTLLSAGVGGRATVHKVSGQATPGAALVASWDTVDLGPRPVGSLENVEFELVNNGDEELVIGDVQADCGCIDLSVEYRNLAPGGTTRLTARQQVTVAGYRRVSIRVATQEGQGELRLFVEMVGTNAPLVLPDPLDLGRLPPSERLSLRLFVIPNGCMQSAEDFSCEASGFRTQASWTLDQTRGCWIGELVLTSASALPLGAGEAWLQIAGAHCESAPREELVLFEIVPEQHHGDWPSCRVVVPARQPRSTRVSFPNIGIRGVAASTRPAGLELEVAADEGVNAVEIRVVDERQFSEAITSHDVALETDLGLVNLRIMVESLGE